jgi:hypothetical protein
MVYEIITEKLQEEIVRMLKFYDKHKILPYKKVRIDVTISGESFVRLSQENNKSDFIDKLIMERAKEQINSS